VSVPPMRPTFELSVERNRDAVLDTLRALTTQEGFKGASTQDHLTITVDDTHRHFWSPWLTIECFESDPPEHTRVEARFSPHPAIWTGVMLTFISLGTTALFAVMFAAAQWMTKHAPSALWVLALALLGAAALYWVSQIGKKLAHDQMVLLHDTVRDALGTQSLHTNDHPRPRHP
jgi:hypothetical protein